MSSNEVLSGGTGPPIGDPGPHPGASSGAVHARMSRLRRRDNGLEMVVRRLLHAAGLRYRVAYRIPGQRRRTIDIAVTRRKIAVYIDGCFWHSCPEHRHLPKSNVEWWVRKMAMNRARDAASTAQLKALGWTVLRFWEHEPPGLVAAAIVAAAREPTGEANSRSSASASTLCSTPAARYGTPAPGRTTTAKYRLMLDRATVTV